MTFASITTYVGPSLKANITPDGFGGVFHELYTFTNTDLNGLGTVRKTYTDLAGLSMFAVVIRGGYHAWTQGIDGNGYPYLQATAFTVPDWQTWPTGTFNTTFAVFVK